VVGLQTAHSHQGARRTVFQRSIVPFLSGAYFCPGAGRRLAPVADFTFARLFGVLLELLSVLLLISIGIRLVGRRAALIAGAFYAIYFPFILCSSMLLLETSTNFWILLALYLLLRAKEHGGRKFMVFAGVVAGLLVLNKPTAMLLAIPLAAGFFFYTHRTWSRHTLINRLLYFFTPAAIIFMLWMGIASIHYGELTLRDPTYAAANLRQSTSIRFEGYDLDIVGKDFWTRSITAGIFEDIPGYTILLVKKFDRLWRRPYNDFKRSFILPYQAGETLHLALIITGLFGLAILLLSSLDRAGWPLVIIGYYTAVHLVFHSISRYNVNAMPMALLTAAYAMDYWWERCCSQRGRSWTRLAAGATCIGVALSLDHQWINVLFNTGLSLWLVVLSLILKSLLLIGGLTILSRVGISTSNSRRRLWVVGGTFLVIATVQWTITLSRDNWAEFSCRLNDSQMKAGTRLFISNLADVKPDEMLTVAADINSGQGRRNTFTVQIGDTSMEFVGGKQPLMELFYPKWTYSAYAQIEPVGLEEFRQYAYIPIDYLLVKRQLERDGYIDIQVAINDRFPEKNNHIFIWGNFETGKEWRYIPGTRFSSIERYVHENDPRFPLPVKYLSDSTISYYILRTETDITVGTDLSPSSGKQSGRFNIFLMHFRPNGNILVY